MKNKSLFGSILAICLIALSSITAFISCEVGLGEAVDVLSPELTINYPLTGSIVRDEFAISGTFDDDGKIDHVSVVVRPTEEGSNAKIHEYTAKFDQENKTWVCSINPFESKDIVIDGSYEATIEIVDTAKHITTKSRQFTIDNTPPVIAVTRPSAIAPQNANSTDYDSYGQDFIISGHVGDACDSKYMTVTVYDMQGNALYTTPSKIKIDSDFSVTLASYGAQAGTDEKKAYDAIYGSDPNGGTKPFLCEIIGYDCAEIVPKDGSEPSQIQEGNKAAFFYMYEGDLYNDVFYPYGTSNAYKILSGSFNSSDARSVSSDKSAAEIKVLLENSAYQVKKGFFSINPRNNPSYIVSGRDALVKDGKDFTDNVSNYEISNGSKVVIEISPGLDATPLTEDTLGLYVIECGTDLTPLTGAQPIVIIPQLKDADGNVLLQGDEKIAARKACISKSGSTYKLTTTINLKDFSALQVDHFYLIGIYGNDAKKIPVKNLDVDYGFKFISTGSAPELNISSPAGSVEYFKIGDDVQLTGWTRVNNVIPELTIELGTRDSEGEIDYQTLKTYSTEADYGAANVSTTTTASGIKQKANFSYQISKDNFSQTSSAEYTLRITSYAAGNKTEAIKTIMYDVDTPTVAFLQEPAFSKYIENTDNKEIEKDDEGNAKQYINGTVTFKVSLGDRYTSINTTDDTKPLPKVEFIQNGQVKYTFDHFVAPANQEFSINTATLLDEGEVTIKASCSDLAGNTNSVEITRIVDQSTDEPVIQGTNNSTILYNNKAALDAGKTAGRSQNIIVANSTFVLNFIDDDGLKTLQKKFVEASGDYNEADYLTTLNSKAWETVDVSEGSTTSQFSEILSDAGRYYYFKFKATDINNASKEFGPIVVLVSAQNPVLTFEEGTSYINNQTNPTSVSPERNTTIDTKLDIGSTSYPFKVYRLVVESGAVITSSSAWTEVKTNLNNTKYTDSFTPTNASGTWDICYKVKDANNHDSNVVRNSGVVIDNTPPSLTITDPKPYSDPDAKKGIKAISESNYRFRGSFNAITVTGADSKKESPIDTFYYKILDSSVTPPSYPTTGTWSGEGGAGWLEGVSTKNGNWEFTYEFADEGTKTLYIYAVDKAGNVSARKDVKFDVDMSYPVVTTKLDTETITVPTIQVRTDNFDFRYKATDTNGSASDVTVTPKVFKDGTEISVTPVDDTDGFKKISISKPSDTTQSNDGSYEFIITATDKVGKETKAERTVNFDTHPPVIVINSPNLNEYQETKLVTVSGTAEDVTSGTMAVWYAYNKTKPQVPSTNTTLDSSWSSNWIKAGTTNWKIENLQGEDGEERKLYICAVDKNGLVNEFEEKVVKVDTKPPVFEETGIGTESVVYKNASYTFTGTASDENGIEKIEITWDGKTGDPEVVYPNASKVWTYTPTLTSNGTFNYKITAKDNSGKSTVITRKVVYDTIAPKAVHLVDYSKKDVYFRIGDANNALSELQEVDANIESLDSTYDYDVGGKYKYGTFGNDVSVKVRGYFEESGSGVETIYYKVCANVSERDAFATGNLEYISTNATGTIAPLGEVETKRVKVNTSDDDFEFRNIPTSYKAIISTGFQEGNNILVFVAVDKAGNKAVDAMNAKYVENEGTTTADSEDNTWNKAATDSDGHAYYSINIDTAKPSAGSYYSEETRYTKNGNADIVIDGVAEDSASGIKSIVIDVNGTTLDKNKITITNSGSTKNLKNEDVDDLSDKKQYWRASIPSAIITKNGTLTTGNITVNVTVTDNAGAGNSQKETGVVVTIDGEPPIVTIDAITDADKNARSDNTNPVDVNGILAISGTASDGKKLESVVVDYKKKSGSDTWHSLDISGTNNWSTSLTTTSLVDNTVYVIRATATDAAGNTETAEQEIFVNQDSDRPVIKFSALAFPAANATDQTVWLRNQTELYGTVSDDDGISDAANALQIGMILSGSTITWKNIPVINGSWSFDLQEFYTSSQNPEGDANGTKSLYFKVIDSAATPKTFESVVASSSSTSDTLNNIYLSDKNSSKKGTPKDSTSHKTEQSTILTLTVDTLPPVIELKGGKLSSDSSYAPGISALKIGGEKYGFDIKVKASDGVGLKATDPVTGTATLTLSESNVITLPAVVTSISEADATHELTFTLTNANVTTLKNAQYNSFVDIKITAEDRAGNKYNASTQINADFKAPTITFTSPVTSLENPESGDATVIFSADEVGTVYYAISTNGTTKPSASTSLTSYKYYEVSADGQPSSTAKTGTISSSISPYSEITSAKDRISGTLYIDDKATPTGIHTGAQLKAYLESFGITTNVREYTPYVDLYVWIKSVDAIGNISETSHKIILNPQGDRPAVTIDYPDTTDTVLNKLGNVKLTVRGSAVDNSGNGLDSVWLQIVPKTHSSGSDYTTSMPVSNTHKITTYSLNANDLNYMKNVLHYDVYKIGTDTPWSGTLGSGEVASDYAIKVSLSGNSWSYTINKSGELQPFGTNVTNNPIYLRAFAYDKDGNKSYETTKYFEIDTSIPSVDSYTLKQYESNGTTVKSAQPYTSGSAYYLKGQWFLEFEAVPHNGSGSSNGTLGEITIKKNDSSPETYTVESSNTVTWCTINANGSATIKYPIVTANDVSNTKVGQTKLTISVSDSTDNSTPYTANIEVNFDNEAPTLLSNTNEFNIPASVKQSSGWYTLSSKVKEETSGSSGLKAVAFYFLRRNTVDNTVYIYDPMIKHSGSGNKLTVTGNSDITYDSGLYWKSYAISSVSGSSFVMTATDSNIHIGGFVKIEGVLYVIKSISGTTYTVDKEVDSSATSAKFAIANIVDNTSSESAKDNTDRVLSSGVTYGYGYYQSSDIKNDDGDRMIEGISGTSANPTWEASIYSRNIPDGPIEIHYIAFDKAENYSIGIIGNSDFNTFKNNTGLFATSDVTEVKGYTNTTTGYGKFVYSYDTDDKAYVSNNAPRLAAVQIGLDINSNDQIDTEEWLTRYALGENSPNKLIVTGESGAIYNTVKGKAAFKPEIVGGNGSIYYSYAMGAKDGSQSAVEAIAEGAAGRTQVQTPLISSGSIDGETTDTLAITDGIVLKVGDFIRLANTKDTENKYYCPDGNYWFNFKLWDSTESTTKFVDSQNAQISVRLALNLNDENNPDMTLVEPVKVDGYGHVDSSSSWMAGPGYDGKERGKAGFVASQYDSDPKVSGQIVITGTLNDDIVLHHMYLKSDAFTGLTNSIVAATYDPTKVLSETVTSRWTVATLPTGFTLVMGEDSFDATGHHVPYTLTIDTAESMNVAIKDVYVEIYADDYGKPTLASLPTSSTGIYTYSLSQKANDSAKSTQYMDIVPYITEVTRANTNISAGTMNRSNIGRYPVAEGETIKVTGYNLATSGAWTVGTHNTETAYTGTKAADGTYSFTMTVPARSGELSVKVNSVVSLNNGNDNSQTYNTETFSMSGTSTRYTASDDRYLSVWNLGNYFASTNGGYECQYPVMTTDNAGNLRASWGAISNANIMFSQGLTKNAVPIYRNYDQPAPYSGVAIDKKSGNNNYLGSAVVTFIQEHGGNGNSFSRNGLSSAVVDGGAAAVQITKGEVEGTMNYSGMSVQVTGNPKFQMDGTNYTAFYNLASYDGNRRFSSFENPQSARYGQYTHSIWYDNVTEGLKYSVVDVTDGNFSNGNGADSGISGAIAGWVVLDGGYTGQDRMHTYSKTGGSANTSLHNNNRGHVETGASGTYANYSTDVFLATGVPNNASDGNNANPSKGNSNMTPSNYISAATATSVTLQNLTITLADRVQVGDTIALLDNFFGNFKIEFRTITEINGNTISWSENVNFITEHGGKNYLSVAIYHGNMNVVSTATKSRNFTTFKNAATDVSSSAGSSAAIDVTTNGYPVVAYYDAANSKLKVVRANTSKPNSAANWTRFDTGKKCSGEVSMKLDGNNNIHIMYNNEDGKMSYLYGAYTANGYTWGEEEVVDDTGSLAYGSISVIYNGTTYVPAMTWLNKANTANGIKYAYRTVAPAAANASTGKWDFMIIPALGNGHYALKENKVSIESRNNWTSTTATVLQNQLPNANTYYKNTATPATVQSVLAYKTSAAYETAYLKTE